MDRGRVRGRPQERCVPGPRWGAWRRGTHGPAWREKVEKGWSVVIDGQSTLSSLPSKYVPLHIASRRRRTVFDVFS